MTMEGNALSSPESPASQACCGNQRRRVRGSDTHTHIARNVLQKKEEWDQLLWSPPLAADALPLFQSQCHTCEAANMLAIMPPTLLRTYTVHWSSFFVILEGGVWEGVVESRLCFSPTSLPSSLLPPLPSFQVLVSQALAMCYHHVTNLVCEVA